jgi:hypothetical protein
METIRLGQSECCIHNDPCGTLLNPSKIYYVPQTYLAKPSLGYVLDHTKKIWTFLWTSNGYDVNSFCINFACFLRSYGRFMCGYVSYVWTQTTYLINMNYMLVITWHPLEYHYVKSQPRSNDRCLVTDESINCSNVIFISYVEDGK